MPTTVGKLKALSNLNVDRNRMAVLPYEVRCSLESLSQSYSLVTCITMPSARRRGRPRTAWMDNIKTWTGFHTTRKLLWFGHQNADCSLRRKIYCYYYNCHLPVLLYCHYYNFRHTLVPCTQVNLAKKH